MPIKDIVEIKNPVEMSMKPIKEKMDIYIPDIENQNISRRNGMVYVLTGSGGSGKSSLLLNMMKSKSMYRGKFHNIFYICPSASFSSVAKHPFEKHDKVYHELSVELLNDIYHQLIAIKERVTEKKEKKEKVYEDDDTESEEEEEIQYSLILIDDMASSLKDNMIAKQLSKMIIKARHLCCSFVFTLQSYFYMPKVLRKQITYITIFKPKNYEEWNTLANELMNLNKEDALKIFDYVFNEPYNHIDIDLIKNTYYKNFNELKIKE
jgi:FtsZ-interacting cell division protein YlmF